MQKNYVYKEAQAFLILHNSDDDNLIADGIWGPESRKALLTYLETKNEISLGSEGTLNKKIFMHMYYTEAQLSKDPTNKQLQAALLLHKNTTRDCQFNDLIADGIWGPESRKAMATVMGSFYKLYPNKNSWKDEPTEKKE